MDGDVDWPKDGDNIPADIFHLDPHPPLKWPMAEYIRRYMRLHARCAILLSSTVFELPSLFSVVLRLAQRPVQLSLPSLSRDTTIDTQSGDHHHDGTSLRTEM
jgi:hypothetical protein